MGVERCVDKGKEGKNGEKILERRAFLGVEHRQFSLSGLLVFGDRERNGFHRDALSS